ncbi:MAG TPA: hypothetical protein VFA15_02440, partial [Nitrososphaera sp.]|nr:hypothetical protein [Nitrososphaera sp.]
LTGIKRPSQEAMQYTATKQGIYDPSGNLVKELPPAKLVVSDGIVIDDGTKVTESNISPASTFYITPIGPATLFLESNGQFFAYHQAYYPNPNNIGSDKTVTAIEMVVAGSDYDKFNAKYDQVRNIIESLKP